MRRLRRRTACGGTPSCAGCTKFQVRRDAGDFWLQPASAIRCKQQGHTPRSPAAGWPSKACTLSLRGIGSRKSVWLVCIAPGPRRVGEGLSLVVPLLVCSGIRQ
eukprot:366571-Chlamydomonas_euryale.AAC.26